MYHDLAGRLRERITSGEWELGTKLPSISELQDEYGIRSLNTVR
ncbi:GntR family transcriptional regulator, partial [Rhodococcus sp. (in: high G+C Gram-positive bacteria)]